MASGATYVALHWASATFVVSYVAFSMLPAIWEDAPLVSMGALGERLAENAEAMGQAAEAAMVTVEQTTVSQSALLL